MKALRLGILIYKIVWLNWYAALAANKEHKLLSDKINLFKNLAVRILIWDCIGIKLKLNWHSLTTAGEPVRKIFIKILVILNSSDCLLRDSSGHICKYCKILKFGCRKSSQTLENSHTNYFRAFHSGEFNSPDSSNVEFGINWFTLILLSDAFLFRKQLTLIVP